MHDELPPLLRAWVEAQATKIGLPGPDDYIVLLLRLEKQRQDLEEALLPAREGVESQAG